MGRPPKWIIIAGAIIVLLWWLCSLSCFPVQKPMFYMSSGEIIRIDTLRDVYGVSTELLLEVKAQEGEVLPVHAELKRYAIGERVLYFKR